MALHGLLGGTMSVANGGKFGHGFAAGAAGKAFMFGLQAANLPLYSQGASEGSFASTDFHHVAARTAIAAVIGGTVSEIGGGTFANGARTAAMQHLFNAEYVEDPANNMWKVFKREIADWWSSNDTADLRMGLGVAAGLASIPYKGVAVALDLKTAESVTVDLANGNYGQAAVDSASVVAGKSTVKLLTDLTKSSDMVKSAIGLGVDKSSSYVLQKDCMNCENR